MVIKLQFDYPSGQAGGTREDLLDTPFPFPDEGAPKC